MNNHIKENREKHIYFNPNKNICVKIIPAENENKCHPCKKRLDELVAEKLLLLNSLETDETIEINCEKMKQIQNEICSLRKTSGCIHFVNDA
jgi:hypothetical protein